MNEEPRRISRGRMRNRHFRSQSTSNGMGGVFLDWLPVALFVIGVAIFVMRLIAK